MGANLAPTKAPSKPTPSDDALVAELLGITPAKKITERKPPFERFATSATILGFIVDSITMISILLAISVGGISVLSIPLTPFHALVVWILATFTYLGILQHHWSKNQITEQLNSNFWLFIYKDLVLGFKKPFLLLPGIFAAVMFIWISVELVLFSTFIGVLTEISIIIALFGFGGYMSERNSPSSKVRNDVDTNWNKWDKRIQTELSTRPWVDSSDLSDMAEILGVDYQYLTYALAKYAAKHSKSAKYTLIYTLPDGKSLGKLLIFTKNINRNKYYY